MGGGGKLKFKPIFEQILKTKKKKNFKHYFETSNFAVGLT